MPDSPAGISADTLAVGVDVGGTTIKYGLVSGDAAILHQLALPTNADAGPDAVLARIAEGVHALLDTISAAQRDAVKGLGIGVPGVMDNNGAILYPPNFPGWEVVPVAERLRPLLRPQLPIAVENDANVAAYAEAHAGAGRGVADFLYITLGTGVGGCIIKEGRIWRGGTGGAGEVGHVSVDMNGRACNCGSRGCVEAYVGQRYMTAIARERLADAPGSLLHTLIAEGGELTPRLINDAAERGDSFAREFLAEMGDILGTALASALNLLDMRVVIAGGGMSQAERTLLVPARRSLRSRVLKSIGDAAELRTARFLADAGIVGAAMLGLSQAGRSMGSPGMGDEAVLL